MQSVTSPALCIERVSHSYGSRTALDNVSFSVPAASFCVLLGLNGAGKSTLFSLITHLYGIQDGRISIFEHNVEKQTGRALALLGVVFQQRTLDLDLTLAQNLAYHAALHGIGRKAARLRAAEALARISLTDRARERVRNLSGGQMRRLEIGRALLHRPRLLLLDEPTVGLDVEARADILDHVRRLVREDGVGVLWATHLMDEVADADDVTVLHRGKLIGAGRASDLIASSGAKDIQAAFTQLTKGHGSAEARKNT